jgi:hypothetical protein
VLPLALCMLGLLFLTIKPLPVGIWKWCSGFAFVILVIFAVTSTKIFRRLDSRQVVQSYGRATRFMFYLFGILGTAVAILQVYNAAFLGVFLAILQCNSFPTYRRNFSVYAHYFDAA